MENSKPSHLAQVLESQGPAADRREAMELYGRLIGVWDVLVREYDESEHLVERRGEWHFAWVLEGRAIQDVWICPPLAERDPAHTEAGNRYGTTIRVYDPSTDSWHVNWINPVTQNFVTLVGRAEGSDIIQDFIDPGDNTLAQWNFSEISGDSFRWTARISHDSGQTWAIDTEFFAKRRARKEI